MSQNNPNYLKWYKNAIDKIELIDGTDICLICLEQIHDAYEGYYDEYTDEMFHINCYMYHWEESESVYNWFSQESFFY